MLLSVFHRATNQALQKMFLYCSFVVLSCSLRRCCIRRDIVNSLESLKVKDYEASFIWLQVLQFFPELPKIISSDYALHIFAFIPALSCPVCPFYIQNCRLIQGFLCRMILLFPSLRLICLVTFHAF